MNPLRSPLFAHQGIGSFYRWMNRETCWKGPVSSIRPHLPSIRGCITPVPMRWRPPTVVRFTARHGRRWVACSIRSRRMRPPSSRSCAVRSLRRSRARSERGRCHRRGTGREESPHPAESGPFDGRPDGGSGDLVVYRDRECLQGAIAGGGRWFAPHARSGYCARHGSPDGGRTSQVRGVQLLLGHVVGRKNRIVVWIEVVAAWQQRGRNAGFHQRVRRRSRPAVGLAVHSASEGANGAPRAPRTSLPGRAPVGSSSA